MSLANKYRDRFDNLDSMKIVSSSSLPREAVLTNSAAGSDSDPAATLQEKTSWDQALLEVETILDGDSSLDDSKLLEMSGKWKSLARQPMPGSVLGFVKDHKTTSKALDVFLTKKFWKHMLMVFSDDNSSVSAYFLWSLVLPHSAAIKMSDDIMKVSKFHKLDEYAVISQNLGEDVRSRGEAFNLARSVIKHYPKLLDYFTSRGVFN